MALNRNRVIAKRDSSRKSKSRPIDILQSLPPDLCASILDQLRDTDLRRIPLVSKAWNSFFSHSSPLESSFRHFVRRRFGLNAPPENLGHLSWGQLYLRLRCERCHLCPEPDINPFVYAGSSTLAVLLAAQGETAEEGLALFPVCTACFKSLLRPSRQVFIPVVESAAVHTVFPALKDRTINIRTGIGYVYTDIPAGVRRDQGVSYHPARLLADICSSLPPVPPANTSQDSP